MNYILNGLNLQTTFGLVFKNGANAMMALPDRKPPLSHDFPELNGIDIDLTNPTFAARDFTFNCLMYAPTVEELTTNYFALFTILKQQGSYNLYNDYINLTITIYYQKQANLSDIQPVSTGGVGVTFDLNFSEANPDINIPNQYLVDDQQRFLVP